MEQRAEERYDFVYGVVVSQVGMPEDSDLARLVSALCALVSRLLVEGRREVTYAVPSVKVISSRKAARAAAERKMVSRSADCGSSASSASERSGQGKGIELIGSVAGACYCIGKGEVMGPKEMCAVSRTLASVLPKRLKTHRILVIRVECMMV